MRLRFTIPGIVLLLLVIGLGAYLIMIIYAPVKFKKQEKERRAVVIEKLKEIRTAQLAYKGLKGEFAGNFGKLINAIKYDTFMVVKTIGNPDDTNQVVISDTFYVAAKDSVFPASYSIDSLGHIPFSDGKVFELIAAQIVKRKVHLKVFQVTAYYGDIFHDLDIKLYDKNKYIRVGKLDEASYAGNWE